MRCLLRSLGVVFAVCVFCWPLLAVSQPTFAPSSVAAFCPSQPAADTQSFRGVNLAGAEFGTVPGVRGKDYDYPKISDLTYYRSKGLRLIRLPFRWERLQNKLYAPLDESQLQAIDAIVSAASALAMYVVLDAHNYGRYGDGIIGTNAVPAEAFADFWKRMAVHFRCKPGIYGYDLSNEPHDMGALWPQDAQAAIDAIRTVDTGTAIIVEGDSWASAQRWVTVNPSFPLRDSSNNIIYEAHCYFDANSGGNYAQTYDQQHASSTLGVDRVRPFVQWLKQHHARGYVGEYSVPASDPRWLSTLDTFLQFIKANNISGTFWAGGNFSCRLSIGPCHGHDAPQMKIVSTYP